MSRIPVRASDLEDPAFAERMRVFETRYGFPSANLPLMARVPGLHEAMGMLGAATLAPGRVGRELKWMVGHVSSRAAGCRFCWAHTAHNAVHQDAVPAEKFEHIWQFETSTLFDDRERAALRLAAGAGVTPNAVTDAHFVELRRHFDDDEILELVAAISLYGFMNRFNDTLAVPLEDPPLKFGHEHLVASGWSWDSDDRP
jgi:alkylhydroperoxidase family enzyme